MKIQDRISPLAPWRCWNSVCRTRLGLPRAAGTSTKSLPTKKGAPTRTATKQTEAAEERARKRSSAAGKESRRGQTPSNHWRGQKTSFTRWAKREEIQKRIYQRGNIGLAGKDELRPSRMMNVVSLIDGSPLGWEKPPKKFERRRGGGCLVLNRRASAQARGVDQGRWASAKTPTKKRPRP